MFLCLQVLKAVESYFQLEIEMRKLNSYRCLEGFKPHTLTSLHFPNLVQMSLQDAAASQAN